MTTRNITAVFLFAISCSSLAQNAMNASQSPTQVGASMMGSSASSVGSTNAMGQQGANNSAANATAVFRPPSAPVCPFNVLAKDDSPAATANAYLRNQLEALAAKCPVADNGLKGLQSSINHLVNEKTTCSRRALDLEYSEAMSEANTGNVAATNFASCMAATPTPPAVTPTVSDIQNCIVNLHGKYIQSGTNACLASQNNSANIDSASTMAKLVETLGAAANNEKCSAGAAAEIFKSSTAAISSFYSNTSSVGIGTAVSAIGYLMNRVISKLAGPSQGERAQDAIRKMTDDDLSKGLLCANLVYANARCTPNTPHVIVPMTNLPAKSQTKEFDSAEEIALFAESESLNGLKNIAEKHSSPTDWDPNLCKDCNLAEVQQGEHDDFCKEFTEMKLGYDASNKSMVDYLKDKSEQSNTIKALISYCENPPNPLYPPGQLAAFKKSSSKGAIGLETALHKPGTNEYEAILQLKVYKETYRFENNMLNMDAIVNSSEKQKEYMSVLKDTFGETMHKNIENTFRAIQDSDTPTKGQLLMAYRQCSLSGSLLNDDDLRFCKKNFSGCGISYSRTKDELGYQDECQNIKKYSKENMWSLLIGSDQWSFNQKITPDKFCSLLRSNGAGMGGAMSSPQTSKSEAR